MKKIYLLSVIFCCFLTVSGNALTNKSNGLKEKIDLEGELYNGKWLAGRIVKTDL
ncbi:MAG: hypothetical protein LBT25_10700 [Candidatus Symbiothrix sp.]|jgi:hypothetical protein|nr:hypothetical protein [Candidatus Symbiothrix sp.]